MGYKHLQEFFLEAMRKGYAAEAKKVGIPHMNHRGIPHVSPDGTLYLIDSCCVNTSTDHSAGTTTIFECDQPVWWMNYVGYYRPDATPYLKAALKFAYGHNRFVGGRGPREFNIGGSPIAARSRSAAVA